MPLVSFEKAVEVTRETTYHIASANRLPQINMPLFVPRRMLRFNYDQGVPIIAERLNETATNLKHQSSEYGLSSGLRSGIQKQNHTYYRAKGIAPHLCKRGCGRFNGVSYEDEISTEILVSLYLSQALTGIKPHSMWTYEIDEAWNFVKIQELRNIEQINKPASKLSLNTSDKKIIQELLEKSAYGEKFAGGKFEIRGDTRLDEITWHLTKKEYAKKESKKRDEILQTLYFQAGIAIGCLYNSGVQWTQGNTNRTNEHTGNIVLEESPFGYVRAKAVDFSHSSWKTKESNPKAQDLEFILKSMQSSIHARTTFSQAIKQKYRHFSEKLREQCFEAMLCGVHISLGDEDEKTLFAKETAPKKVRIPKRMVMPAFELYEYCNNTTAQFIHMS
jgi:hypothetical protein